MPTQSQTELYFLSLLRGGGTKNDAVLDDDVEVLLDWDGLSKCWNALQALLLHFLSIAIVDRHHPAANRSTKLHEFFQTNREQPLVLAVALDTTRLADAPDLIFTRLNFILNSEPVQTVRHELADKPQMEVVELADRFGAGRFHFFPPPNLPGLFEAICRLQPGPREVAADDNLLRRVLSVKGLETMPELAKVAVFNLIIGGSANWVIGNHPLNHEDQLDLCRRFPLLVADFLAADHLGFAKQPLIELTSALLNELSQGQSPEDTAAAIKYLMSGTSSWLVANSRQLLAHCPVWEVANWVVNALDRYFDQVRRSSGHADWPLSVEWMEGTELDFGLAVLDIFLDRGLEYGKWMEKYLGFECLAKLDAERFEWVVNRHLKLGHGSPGFLTLAIENLTVEPELVQQWLNAAPAASFYKQEQVVKYIVEHNLHAGAFLLQNVHRLGGAGYQLHEGELTRDLVRVIHASRPFHPDYYWANMAWREAILSFPGHETAGAAWFLDHLIWHDHNPSCRLEQLEREFGGKLDDPQTDADRALRRGLTSLALNCDGKYRDLALQIITSEKRRYPWLTDDAYRALHFRLATDFEKMISHGPTLLAICKAEDLRNRFFTHYLDKVLPDPSTLHWLLDGQKPRIAGLILAQVNDDILNPMMLQWVQEFDLIDTPHIARLLEQLKGSSRSSIAQLAVDVLKAARAKRAAVAANISPEPES